MARIDQTKPKLGIQWYQNPPIFEFCPIADLFLQNATNRSDFNRHFRHRPLPHPRETLVEGEAGDLIPSLPFAEAGYGEEDARGTRIVLP